MSLINDICDKMRYIENNKYKIDNKRVYIFMDHQDLEKHIL